MTVGPGSDLSDISIPRRSTNKANALLNYYRDGIQRGAQQKVTVPYFSNEPSALSLTLEIVLSFTHFIFRLSISVARGEFTNSRRTSPVKC